MCNSGKVNLSKPQVSHLYDGDEKYLPYRFVVKIMCADFLPTYGCLPQLKHSVNVGT